MAVLYPPGDFPDFDPCRWPNGGYQGVSIKQMVDPYHAEGLEE
jgi:hypothetical protein